MTAEYYGLTQAAKLIDAEEKRIGEEMEAALQENDHERFDMLEKQFTAVCNVLVIVHAEATRARGA